MKQKTTLEGAQSGFPLAMVMGPGTEEKVMDFAACLKAVKED